MKNNEIIEIRIPKTVDFDTYNLFECGQCFRWINNDNGVYSGVAFDKVARVYKTDCGYRVKCNKGSYEKVWHDYFDLSLDYAEIRGVLSKEPVLKDALDFGRGIRILRQEPWEALVSFILSQCNNIPRIKGIINTLCSLFGEKIHFDGDVFYSFPSAERIAALSDYELNLLRAGYRAKYIKQVAEKAASRELDLELIDKLPTDEARSELKKLSGVGDKVANCVLLYGYHKLDAFPVDVWMRRALEMQKIDFKGFESIKGIAQQYVFHYIRNYNKS